MTALVEIGLINAVLATALAVAVWLATRLWRRPDVAWCLWLLVLTKLLAPPVVAVSWQAEWLAGEPLQSESNTPQEPSHDAASPTCDQDSRPTANVVARIEALPTSLDAQAVASASSGNAVPSDSSAETPVSVSAVDPDRKMIGAATGRPRWHDWAAGLWLAGSLDWIMLAVVRMTRFARLVRRAEPAPSWLEAETRGVAVRLNWRRPIRVRLVTRRMAPLVWRMFSTTTILLPAELLAGMSPDARRTLIAHELAHATKPVVVRWLELAAIAVYWWHPVAWWARRELEQAEELCCDARILNLFPALARTYASALLSTLDFVAFDDSATPLGARAFSQRRQITRRLAMIMSNNPPKGFGWRSRVVLTALALAVLPWSIAPVTAAPNSAISLVVDAALTAADIKTLEARLDRLEKMVQALTTEVQAMRKDKADDAPAKVVGTVPKTGAKDVDPNLKELRVTFSKDMHDGTWSWTQSSKFAFPEPAGDIHYEADQRTCVMPVKLEPGKTYWIGLNSAKFHNFKDTSGRPSVPYELKFTTKAE